MGLLSGIGKVVKGVVGSITGGDILGAATGLIGAQQANSATAASTREQMDFQERMRNTAYQAAVADMRAAGLNPRLTYGQGGASVPVGSAYAARDVSQSAREGMLASANLRNIREQNNNLRSQQDLNSASAAAARADAVRTLTQAEGARLDNVIKGIDAGWAEKFGITGAGTRAVTNSARSVVGGIKGLFKKGGLLGPKK